jgi:hypothetical protein
MASRMIGVSRCDTLFLIRTELLCADMESDSLVHEAVERYQRTIDKCRHPKERIGITYPIVSKDHNSNIVTQAGK